MREYGPISPSCFNETDRLRQVIVGYENTFRPIKPINETQQKLYGTGNQPTFNALVPEFTALNRTLKQEGVDVLSPEPCFRDTGVNDQLTTRDLGFVIGKKFFVANMAREPRKREKEGIGHTIQRIKPAHIIRVPEDIVIEGGDVIVDKGRVFVGIGQRTTEEGVNFLEKTLGDIFFEVVPIELKSLTEGEDVLHLDCAFNPVGRNHALIYPDGIKDMPSCITETYKLIEVTQAEQHELGVNVFSVSPTTVISRDATPRVNQSLRDIGLRVIELKFDQAPKTGGSIRCCTLPLRRTATPTAF